jgi:hypothetical protein
LDIVGIDLPRMIGRPLPTAFGNESRAVDSAPRSFLKTVAIPLKSLSNSDYSKPAGSISTLPE